jgi:hypothetical protein
LHFVNISGASGAPDRVDYRSMLLHKSNAVL